MSFCKKIRESLNRKTLTSKFFIFSGWRGELLRVIGAFTYTERDRTYTEREIELRK